MGRSAHILTAGLIFGLLAWCFSTPAEQTAVVFVERFDAAALDLTRWALTRQHDFETAVVDLVPGAKGEGGRLRLRASTIGTDDRTVKFLGVRTQDPVVDLTHPVSIEATLDWNSQANGCYLTAGLFLCPVATDGNPVDQPDWLKVEYLGVPPGLNGRCLVASRTLGRLRLLSTEGWPDQQRTGRPIGVQRLRLRLDGRQLAVDENDETLYATDTEGPAFDRAYLYLQLSSHSNYRAREVYFDDVCVAATARQ